MSLPLRAFQERARNPVETFRAQKRHKVLVRQQATKTASQSIQHSLNALKILNQ
jgi:hypothetical protein